MTMTNEEIVRDWKQAKSPKDQVQILADLNQCHKKDIVKILFDSGVLSGTAIYQYRKSGLLPQAADTESVKNAAETDKNAAETERRESELLRMLREKRFRLADEYDSLAAEMKNIAVNLHHLDAVIGILEEEET